MNYANIRCFTGSVWERIPQVEGPFVEAKKNLKLRFRGSENQRLIDVPKTLKQSSVVLREE